METGRTFKIKIIFRNRSIALKNLNILCSFQLLYCLQVYRGDEKIKNFIWDLITPTESGEENKISRNHSGLHNLVPRGRNAKGKIAQSSSFRTSVFVVLVF